MTAARLDDQNCSVTIGYPARQRIQSRPKPLGGSSPSRSPKSYPQIASSLSATADPSRLSGRPSSQSWYSACKSHERLDGIAPALGPAAAVLRLAVLHGRLLLFAALAPASLSLGVAQSHAPTLHRYVTDCQAASESGPPPPFPPDPPTPKPAMETVESSNNKKRVVRPFPQCSTALLLLPASPRPKPAAPGPRRFRDRSERGERRSRPGGRRAPKSGRPEAAPGARAG